MLALAEVEVLTEVEALWLVEVEVEALWLAEVEAEALALAEVEVLTEVEAL
ncbi:hypothetical protein [Parablautia intestinalis]|uniref:hypothetical protein n=1 Tax=Parablautia intestinalis TaxID=2320100 RepID=UPI00259CA555|nr:hypothetical protein [Parablautia intestinalis]